MTYIDPRLQNKSIEYYEQEIRALRRRNSELFEELQSINKRAEYSKRLVIVDIVLLIYAILRAISN